MVLNLVRIDALWDRLGLRKWCLDSARLVISSASVKLAPLRTHDQVVSWRPVAIRRISALPIVFSPPVLGTSETGGVRCRPLLGSLAGRDHDVELLHVLLVLLLLLFNIFLHLPACVLPKP